MLIIRPKLAASVVAALLISAPAALPATPVKLSGSIAGIVRSTTGVPQMGASVLLFNRSERLIEQAITNEHGLFAFQALTPDLYSVRVSLASFVPALKQKISVQPGIQSLLYVNMASVLSSIELVNLPPGQGALMSDDWKWVLKQSASTRPVLRLLPGSSASDPKRRDKPAGSVFSDTRGVLSLSAGEPGSLGASSTQADLGTAFALATSVFGRNQLELSGNVGYSAQHRASGRWFPDHLQPRRNGAGSRRHGAASLFARARRPVHQSTRRFASLAQHVGFHARQHRAV